MTGEKITIPCHKISGGCAAGDILVSSDDICFFLTDPETGILVEDGHDLDGKSVAGKVLVFPSGKGSAVVQDEGLFALKEHGNAPSAMIIQHPDTVLVFGALLMSIPVVDGVAPSAYAALSDSAHATVDADAGEIVVAPTR